MLRIKPPSTAITNLGGLPEGLRGPHKPPDTSSTSCLSDTCNLRNQGSWEICYCGKPGMSAERQKRSHAALGLLRFHLDHSASTDRVEGAQRLPYLRGMES
jgi:hypothetical protein